MHVTASLDENEVAAARAAIWLPPDLHFPPDLSVPLIVSGATVAQWEREDAAGSGDAAYALGVRLFQAGDLGHARDYLVRAAERGSAAGAYARYQVAGMVGSSPEEALGLLTAADDAGSADAASTMANVHLMQGDRAAADAAVQRAIERARAEDAAGSADAALLLAALDAAPGHRLDAYKRADARGAGVAALEVADAAEQQDEVEAAMQAYLRAVRRGKLGAGIRLGELLAEAGRRRDARQIWRETCVAATAAGDTDLMAEVQAKLRPPLRAEVRSHPRTAWTIGIVCALAAVTLAATGNWRWLVTAFAAALLVLLSRVPSARGAPRHGLPRPGSVLVMVVHAFVIALLALWAAGWLGGDDLMRWLSGVAAVIIAGSALSSLVHDLRDPPDPQTLGTLTRCGRRSRLGSGPSRLGCDLEEQGPGIRESIATNRRPTPMWIRRTSVLLTATSALAGAVLLAIPVVAPDLVPSFTELVEVASSFGAIWLVAVCVWRIVVQATLRPPRWELTTFSYGVLAVVIAIVATIFGLWDLPALSA